MLGNGSPTKDGSGLTVPLWAVGVKLAVCGSAGMVPVWRDMGPDRDGAGSGLRQSGADHSVAHCQRAQLENVSSTHVREICQNGSR